MHLYAVITTKVVFVTVNSKKENFVSLNRNSNRFSVKFSELVSVFHRSKQILSMISSAMKLSK